MPLKYNSLGIDYKAVLKGPHARLLVGQVKAINERDNSRKVACLKLSLDPKLLKYWNARRMFRSVDSEYVSSNVGDIVLISQLKKPMGHLITHQIQEVIYKNGAVIDPISGELCHGISYADHAINPKLEKYRESIESEV